LPLTSEIGEGLQVLSRTQCLALLPTVPIGRVVVTIGALPAAFPVSFALVDAAILFVTGEGTKLSAALKHAVVAFEVDDFDPAARRGWSVLVQGISCVVDDERDLRWTLAQDIDVWGNRDASHVAAVSLEHVSGRLLGPWPADGPPS